MRQLLWDGLACVGAFTLVGVAGVVWTGWRVRCWRVQPLPDKPRALRRVVWQLLRERRVVLLVCEEMQRFLDHLRTTGQLPSQSEVLTTGLSVSQLLLDLRNARPMR